MYEYLDDAALEKLIAAALRDEERRAEDFEWIDKKASWADLEQRLKAIEEAKIKAPLNDSCAMRQLRKIIQKARDMRYYLLGKCWDKY